VPRHPGGKVACATSTMNRDGLLITFGFWEDENEVGGSGTRVVRRVASTP